MATNNAFLKFFLPFSEHEPQYLALVLSLYLLILIPLRALQQKLSPSTDTYLLNIFLGLISGLLLYNFEPFGKDYQGFTFMPPQDLLALYLPIYITASIYQLDYYIYIRCLPHVMIICLSNFINFLLMLGLIHWLLHPHENFLDAILLALVMMPIQPKFIQNILKHLAQYRHLGVILESESLVSLMFFYTFFVMFRGIKSGILNTSMHYALFLLRNLLGGAVIGSLLGYLQIYFLHFVYNDALQANVISIGMTFFIYFLTEYLLSCSGILAIILSSSNLASEKHKFPLSLDEHLTRFWNTVYVLTEEGLLCLIIAEYVPYIINFFDIGCFFSAFVIYFCSNAIRLLSLVCVGCLFKLMPYKLDVSPFLILSWGNVKGCINLFLVLILLIEPETYQIAKPLLVEMLFLVVLSIAINNSTMKIILKLVGLSELSRSREKNMINCLKFIQDCRDSLFSNLKTHRLMMDMNWKILREMTVLRNPYKLKDNKEEAMDDEDIEFINNANSAVCPECFKEIPFELTSEEFDELFREARGLVLKAKKVSVVKQYEEGLITKNTLQILVHTIEIILESREQNTKMLLTSYLQPSSFYLHIRDFLVDRISTTVTKEPKKVWAKGCYYLINHVNYDTFILIVTVVYVSYTFLTIYFGWTSKLHFAIGSFLLIYTVDQILKFLSLTKESIIKHFRNPWNVFDLVILIVELSMYFFIMFNWSVATEEVFFLTSLWILRICAFCRIIRIFSLITTFPKLISKIEYVMDSRMAFGFEIASALVVCCDDILENIINIVELNILRDVFIEDLQDEKAFWLMKMQKIQIEHPWVAITVKTKQIIRSTLIMLIGALKELKSSGFVDNLEYQYIKKEIREKQMFLRNIKFVRASEPKVIFKEVPWMKGKPQIIDFLYDKVETVNWNAGQIIIQDNENSIGVYIVVTGILRLKYDPILSKGRELDDENGYIPVIDYFSSINLEEEYEDNISTGNSFGELCLLTGRPYYCTIIADSACQAFLLRNYRLTEAMQLDKNEVSGLEAKMWKHATLNIAIDIMKKHPNFTTLTKEAIKLQLERAFVPNLKRYKVFHIIKGMENVLLVYGIAADFYTGTVYHAPMMIPQDTEKLYLPKSSFFHLKTDINTKLMIIPLPETNELELMAAEEEIAELISMADTHYLLHDIEVDVKRKLKQKLTFNQGIFNRPSTSRTSNTSAGPIVKFESQLDQPEKTENSPELETIQILQPPGKNVKKKSFPLPGAVDPNSETE